MYIMDIKITTKEDTNMTTIYNSVKNILDKAGECVCNFAEFVGTAIGSLVTCTIIFVFGLAAMVAALSLWLSVPYFTCTTIFSEINSQWQVFAMLGIFAGWAILTKIVYDRLTKRK